ncbi:hypothetical protein WJX72_006478 [[Myrmecia] bisecta]|uniref:Uncharacterized protein n=1 Tax=[Myrmecia] bisecta TaxID=41462 RepID=A0AAW1PKG3_9CHLO
MEMSLDDIIKANKKKGAPKGARPGVKAGKPGSAGRDKNVKAAQNQSANKRQAGLAQKRGQGAPKTVTIKKPQNQRNDRPFNRGASDADLRQHSMKIVVRNDRAGQAPAANRPVLPHQAAQQPRGGANGVTKGAGGGYGAAMDIDQTTRPAYYGEHDYRGGTAPEYSVPGQERVYSAAGSSRQAGGPRSFRGGIATGVGGGGGGGFGGGRAAPAAAAGNMRRNAHGVVLP